MQHLLQLCNTCWREVAPAAERQHLLQRCSTERQQQLQRWSNNCRMELQLKMHDQLLKCSTNSRNAALTVGIVLRCSSSLRDVAPAEKMQPQLQMNHQLQMHGQLQRCSIRRRCHSSCKDAESDADTTAAAEMQHQLQRCSIRTCCSTCCKDESSAAEMQHLYYLDKDLLPFDSQPSSYW